MFGSVPLLKRKITGTGRGDGPSTSFHRLGDTPGDMENMKHKIDAFDNFSRLRSEGKMCDFVIEIQGEEMHVHSAVLVATSKYYEGMLTHDTTEKKNGRVQIHDVELSAGKQCIDYMYTGKVDFPIKNPEDLIFAAELMELPSLTDSYFEFVKENLSSKNCLKYVKLAETFGRISFAEFFSKFSAKHFEEIVDSEDFSSSSVSLIQQCLEYVPDGGHYIEKLKWQAMKNWIDEDIENRKPSFLKLFKMLKLENASEDFLKNDLHLDPLVEENSECNKLILNALSSPTRPKNYAGCSKTAPYIIACCSYGRMLYQYQLKTKKWSRFARIPANVYEKNPDIVSVDGEIYLTTGDAVSRFKNGELVTLKATGHQSTYHRCVARGTTIYMIFYDRTYKFDTKNNAMTVLQTPLALGEGFFVISSDQCIYAMGGSNTRTSAKEFEFASETWESIAPMQMRRSHGAGVWYDDKVYVIGGDNYHTNGGGHTEFYSRESNMWAFLSPNFRCAHYKCKAFFIDDKVYILGGKNNSSSTFGFDMVATEYSCNSTSKVTPDRDPHQSITEIDFKESTTTRIPSMKIECGLACAVYTN